MKIMAFFNEKGGVGKTSLTIMYASWLRYRHGIRSAVLDYDNRCQHYRDNEMRQRKAMAARGAAVEPVDGASLWPIYTVKNSDIMALEKKGALANAFYLEDMLRRGAFGDAEVLLVDLPGATMGRQFMQLIISRLVGLWCLILDRDPQTITASLSTLRALAEGGQTVCGFMNQVQSYTSLKTYEEMAGVFMARGLKVLPDVVSYTERMKKINEPAIMRSTLSYPDWEMDCFKGSRDLGLESLFADITRLLDTIPDARHSAKSDLSFARDIAREFNDRRQLMVSSFPEMTFPAEMFPASRRS